MDVDLALRSFVPRRSRPGGVSSWTGHQPFAYLLVGELRPASIVELGTLHGESYFTFCQAVAELGLDCRCTAVDTWRGDEHAGRYGEEVFGDVSAHNAAHYAHFSRLLRTTFDEALAQFADASIDLLHIDGFHTYEVVKHDFESWLPKVRPGGVVLLHDIAVRERDFGVWRLWQEIADRHPHFAFDHGFGLGVIRVPGGPPLPAGACLEALFSPAACEMRWKIFDRLATRGRLIDGESRIAELETLIARLHRRVARARRKRRRITSIAVIAVAISSAVAAAALAWILSV